MAVLQTIDLKKYYGQGETVTKALDGINLEIRSGEFATIVGTSGSGKSTLLHMMGGLDYPTSGKVIINGEDISKKTEEQLTRQIRAVVRKQAHLLTVAGLPFGLFAGFLAGRLCLPVVMSFFAHETLPTALTVSPHPAIFTAAAGLTAFNVWIGTHKPARKASGVSPIEAIHFTETAPKKQARKSHCGRFSLFHMAWANLSRSRGRSVRIVLSMILCMLMLNSAVLLSGSLDSEKFVRTLNKTDFLLANTNTFQITKGFASRADGLSSDALAFAEGLSGTENFGYLYKNTLDDPDVSFDYGYSGLQIVEQTKGALGVLETAYDNGFRMNLSESSGFPIGNVYGMSDGFLSRLTVYEGETDPEILKEKMAGGGSIIIGVPVQRDT